MTVNEQRRKSWKEMHGKPIGVRIRYFWDYYKWHTVTAFTILALAISYTVAVLNEPDATANGMLINAYNYFRYEEVDKQAQELASAYLEHQGLSKDQLELNMDTSRVYYVDGKDDSYNYDTIQLMLTYTATDSLDYVTGDPEALIDLAYMQFFRNLEDHLPEEMLQKYKDGILYIDMALVEQREEAFDKNLDISNLDYPDASKPEHMEVPVPVLICVDSSASLRDIYEDNANQIFFAFTSNDGSGNTLDFLEFLLQGN